MTFTKLPPPQTNFDGLTVFQSGLVVHFNRDTSLHHSVPLHEFDHETAVLKYSLQEAENLFADLCELADKMLNADEHFAENEEAMETSEQIQIELEGRRTLLAIDGRKFKTEASSQSLEKFIGNLLNAEVDVKIRATRTDNE
jgi:hypothetical protein